MGPVLGFVGAIFFGVGAGASLAYSIAVGLARMALLSLASKALTPKVDLSQTAADKLVTVKSSIQPQAFVYGQDMLSGPLLFAQVENGTTLHRLVALTGREIDSFVAFRIDDTDIDISDDIPDASDTVSAGLYADVVDIDTRTGTSSQTAIAALTTAFSSLWTSAHRARGWSLLSTTMRVEGNSEAFDAGIPQNLRGVVKGHLVYDPRLDSTQVIDSTTSPVTYGSGAHRADTSSTWAWSENPALCLADFFMWDQVGMGEAPARIDWELVADAADICEQLVFVPPAASPSNTQQRYTCNFTFYGDQSREQVKQMLEGAMLGRSIYSQGKWRMWAGAALTSTVTLSEANMGGGKELTAEASTGSKQRYNRVRGKFVDPSRNYTANPYPEQRNAAYVSEDVDIKYKTVDFNACNNSYECQRNAIIILRQSRNQNVLRFVGNWSCFRIQVGHVVDLNIAELGWSATTSPVTTKKYFVSEWQMRQDGSGVTLTLVEENDSVWDDPAVGDYTTRSATGELVPPAALAVKLSNATISNERTDATCTAGVKLEAAGLAKYSNAVGAYSEAGVPDNEWLNTGTAEYWARCTLTNSPQGALDVGTVDTWESLSADRTYAITQTTTGTDTANITLEISSDSAGATILTSADFVLSAEYIASLVALNDHTITRTQADTATPSLGIDNDGNLFRSPTGESGPSVDYSGEWFITWPELNEYLNWEFNFVVTSFTGSSRAQTSAFWHTVGSGDGQDAIGVDNWFSTFSLQFYLNRHAYEGAGTTTIVGTLSIRDQATETIQASAEMTINAVHSP